MLRMMWDAFDANASFPHVITGRHLHEQTHTAVKGGQTMDPHGHGSRDTKQARATQEQVYSTGSDSRDGGMFTVKQSAQGGDSSGHIDGDHSSDKRGTEYQNSRQESGQQPEYNIHITKNVKGHSLSQSRPQNQGSTTRKAPPPFQSSLSDASDTSQQASSNKRRPPSFGSGQPVQQAPKFTHDANKAPPTFSAKKPPSFQQGGTPAAQQTHQQVEGSHEAASRRHTEQQRKAPSFGGHQQPHGVGSEQKAAAKTPPSFGPKKPPPPPPSFSAGTPKSAQSSQSSRQGTMSASESSNIGQSMPAKTNTGKESAPTFGPKQPSFGPKTTPTFSSPQHASKAQTDSNMRADQLGKGQGADVKQGKRGGNMPRENEPREASAHNSADAWGIRPKRAGQVRS